MVQYRGWLYVPLCRAGACCQLMLRRAGGRGRRGEEKQYGRSWIVPAPTELDHWRQQCGATGASGSRSVMVQEGLFSVRAGVSRAFVSSPSWLSVVRMYFPNGKSQQLLQFGRFRLLNSE